MDEEKSLLMEILTASKACRQAQKAYFKNRTQENFQAALGAEKRLDGLLRFYDQTHGAQSLIFPEEVKQ